MRKEDEIMVGDFFQYFVLVNGKLFDLLVRRCKFKQRYKFVLNMKRKFVNSVSVSYLGYFNLRLPPQNKHLDESQV